VSDARTSGKGQRPASDYNVRIPDRALAIAKASRSIGKKIMVGNMGGSPLAMALAFVVRRLCDVADLDGPFALAGDSLADGIYRDGQILKYSCRRRCGVRTDVASSARLRQFLCKADYAKERGWAVARQPIPHFFADDYSPGAITWVTA
jgi:hypothetical protein